MSRREQLARVLERVKAPEVILRARKRLKRPFLGVLTYHSVGDPGDSYPYDAETLDATPDQFDRQLQLLAEHFTVIGVDELVACLRGEPLPPNAVMITFDDGYKSNLTVVTPMLQKYGFKAVFFVATNFITERRAYWWDRVNYILKKTDAERVELEYPEKVTLDLTDRKAAILKALGLAKETFGMDMEKYLAGLADAAGVPWSEDASRAVAEELILSWDDLREMRAAGMDIESHTRAHRVLGTLAEEDLRDELAGSREDIGREVGLAARTIAYPVGKPIIDNPTVLRAVQEAGYTAGFSSQTGANNWRNMHPFDVARYAMDRGASMELFLAQLALPQLRHGASMVPWAS